LTNLGVTTTTGTGWGDLANQTAAMSMPKVFVCPAAPRAATANQTYQKDYGINGGTQSGGCCAERSTTKSSEGMAFLGSQIRVIDVVDGTSNTFLFMDMMNTAYKGEISFGFGSNPFFFVNEPGQGYVVGASGGTGATYYAPNLAANTTVAAGATNPMGYNTRGPASPHVGGVFAVMVDGHVAWVPNEADPTIYVATFTRAGKEAVANPYN
jgi:hypothetical protein